MELRELRNESRIKLHREKVYEQLGKYCHVCGDTEVLHIHHIVPLVAGGTNDIWNLLVLCDRCHRAVHFERDYRKRDKAGIGGRPKVDKPEGADKYIEEYLYCRIGLTECSDMLNTGRKKKTLRDYRWFKEYMANNKIKNFENKIDLKLMRGKKFIPIGTYIGCIEYEDGTIKKFYSDKEIQRYEKAI